VATARVFLALDPIFGSLSIQSSAARQTQFQCSDPLLSRYPLAADLGRDLWGSLQKSASILLTVFREAGAPWEEVPETLLISPHRQIVVGIPQFSGLAL